jgi:hypothetical protein
MGDYADASVFDCDDEPCRHGRMICEICACEEELDEDEIEDDDEQ